MVNCLLYIIRCLEERKTMKKVLCILALTALLSTIGATQVKNKTSKNVVPNNASNATVCVRAGRSCVDSKEFEKFTIMTLELRRTDACCSNATCELQPDGQCGFTPTEELSQCLKNPPPFPY
jgi:hypothetical protein